ncbi:MAG: 3-oxoacyl-[acyl-carrier-protein] reductase [Deltaproteobacteria bacterium]|jgi:3-oxoacyl-[acyl-carrier protein] reductase|nr:3-oxoacyl-[acyl-carrier-protein] reductase [Candidatus Dadabacteria bacterium]TDJ03849.1 MAG: 3-oxoacyl-[acyl-carrier-protein] reductase [Deltaproteobacteria bacterium]
MDFNGKVALITGSSRGIGKSIAKDLASKGAFVIINYASNEQAAQSVKDEIESKGGKCEIRGFDVSSYSQVNDEIDSIVKDHGELNFLVNNAGITRDTLLMRMKEEDWDAVINVNLKGVFNCTKAASKYMVKQKSGRIVNISSVVGEMGNPGQSNYSATKAGIIGFTKSVSRELASRNITVNSIAPGFIETDITSGLSDKVKEYYLGQIPLSRFGSPEDVSGVVSFLLSDAASYITGEVIRVNGGMYT